jgi:exoribonuclease R
MLLYISNANKMREYRIIITNRQYTEWHFVEPATYTPIPMTDELKKICPIKHKLFSMDIFTIGEDGTTPIVTNSAYNSRQIAGVLILETQKTYGRNETGKRPLFMCIPNDRYLPHFLIPYELKLGFSKKIQNRYVVFKYNHWREKHPHGILTENLGVVGQLDVFYEYQIYCRNLNDNINEINAKTREALSSETKEVYIEKILRESVYKIVDKTAHETPSIFSIDPKNSVDYDDAFSIRWDAVHSKYTVCIYIANVFVWLDKMHLWKSLSRRVSTIYLPDRKRPMLPTILSDNLCSLHAGQTRFATEMKLEIILNDITGKYEIGNTEFQTVAVKVANNYVYDSPELWKDRNYQLLVECTEKMGNQIQDSHDVVAFWMIQMNSICGNLLAEKQLGIFRQTVRNESQQPDILPAHLSPATREFVTNWKNTCGQYCLMEDNTYREHALMRKTSYCHITSPIRRLVDLLNQMIFMYQIQGVLYGSDAASFLSQWITEIDYINTTMRSIRKVQNDCSVLEYCHRKNDSSGEIYRGVVFDRVDKNDGTFVYMVYLEGIKFVSKIICNQVIENYTPCDFQMFVFEDEYSLKKKIKLQLLHL